MNPDQTQTHHSNHTHTTRRGFLQTAAITTAAISLVPSVLVQAAGAQSPNEKLNIAGIGVGGMGRKNLKACSEENIVALCDVALDAVEETRSLPKAARFPWAAEGTVAVDDWWKPASQASRNEFLQAVHDGQIEVTALACNSTTPRCAATS